ncbi:MAG: hypothetical protein GY820_39785 [Gammaproteobacteria bacterium]|nr:hypothetical protein [Gammaproteobacteria bacterium]
MPPDAVHRAGITFLQSAVAGTPKATRKNRRINGKSNQQWYVVLTQAKAPKRILLPNAKRGSEQHRAKMRILRAKLQADFKEKPRVGASKRSWSRAFSDLGKSVRIEAINREKRILMASRARKLGTKFTPAVRITNDLSYLTKIAPGLEAHALEAAGKKLLHLVEEGIEKQARKWK